MNRNRKLLTLFFFFGALTTACHSSKVEPAAVNSSAPVQPAANAYKPGPQPIEAEMRDAIKRNYEDAVTIDNRQPTYYLTGDFNGDNSEDIAVVVKPGKGKLAELNGEYANWILEDPHQLLASKKKPARVSVAGDEVLLAVIHGYEREGWRNALARQTYLLKNAVGKDLEKHPSRQLSNGSGAPPLLKGDVIREKFNGSDGIIYWTGAKYAWRTVSS